MQDASIKSPKMWTAIEASNPVPSNRKSSALPVELMAVCTDMLNNERQSNPLYFNES